MSSHTRQTTFHNRRVDTDKWCHDLNVIERLVPFDLRGYDPIEVISALRTQIWDTAPTALTIPTWRANERLPYDFGPFLGDNHELFYLAGTWPLSERFKKSTFINPNYVHLDTSVTDDIAITDDDRRLNVLRDCAGLGIIPLDTIYPMFGFEERTQLLDFINNNSLDYFDRQRAGFTRLTRTLHLLREWGYSWDELSLAFGRRPTDLQDWADWGASFEVPDDPTR